ncbi:ArsR family transcriptional regulator [Candidatus Bathyarchaeota archaeon]|nr:ArsR family transcriptional regulator [Candidatus Bathyarchaeota archaeon]
MSISHRVRGVKILKAVSSSVRLQLLNLLFDRGPLSYTDLMSSLKMNPNRDAGRFAYHLKFLLKADLIEADVETKKYCLTELGKMVLDVADRIDKKAFKPRGMPIRTSRFALEEFDVNKIANSLVKETKMPADLAQKIAKEAEKRLLKSKTKYLTAPLIREVVNTILIEKGLEEYRHKLTRLGLPVFDVTTLIDAKNKMLQKSTSIHETSGEIVLREYMLLNVFSRDIADAHLSGLLHIRGLSSWILKPSEIMHDLRFFFQNGLNLEKTSAFQFSYSPPQNLESALGMTFNVLLHSAKEIDELQTIDYFNVFLAPFIRGVENARVREALRLFIANVNQHVDASFGLELTIPDFVADKPAFGPLRTHMGKYGDFVEEIQVVASLLLEILAEQSLVKPLFNPKAIIKIRSETFTNERAKTILLKAHQLSLEKGLPYFANSLGKNRKHSVFSASGFRLDANLSKDWEIDTLRTGCLGCVTVNLPRITYDSGKDVKKFFEIFRERLELSARALEIKDRALKQHGKSLLPFLTQSTCGDHYFRVENCSRLINLAGLKEAAEAFHGKSVSESEKTLELIEDIIKDIEVFTQRTSRKRGRRLSIVMLPDFEASERLVQMDIEKYGIGKIRFSGTREKPFYTTVNKLIDSDGKVSPESLRFGQKIHGLHGALTATELEEAEHKADELMTLTKQFFENYDLEFLTYNRRITYCANCKKSWIGLLHKCPSCGSIGTLTTFDRFAST